MGFLDSILGSGSSTQKTTSSSTTQLPDWVNKAAQANYKAAVNIASRPYTAYPFQRIAGFTGDQNKAMSMLRDYAPNAAANGGAFSLPRLIDDIGPGGSIDAYMSPYIDNVLDRTQTRIRQATDMAHQWSGNMAQHQDGAFGDARHGIADAQIEQKGIQEMGDAAANGYAAAYDNAQGLRQFDINQLLSANNATNANQQALLSYIDSLYRSGSNQQSLDQNSLELAYQDFLRQLNYPVDQYNLLVAGLNQAPYETTTDTTSKTKTPTSSTGAQILGAIGSIASMF